MGAGTNASLRRLSYDAYSQLLRSRRAEFGAGRRFCVRSSEATKSFLSDPSSRIDTNTNGRTGPESEGLGSGDLVVVQSTCEGRKVSW